jgi:type II secretory pathway pseudopilin PulG
MSSDHAVLRRLRAVRFGEGGFTLVEAVVALVVLALIFSALVAVSISAVRASLYSRQNQQAADLVGQRIEALRPLSIETLANVATDLSGDARVQNCGGQPCIDPGTGVKEDLVLDPNGSVTPHITTVSSTTSNQTRYTVATYVTVPDGQDANYQRRVTVFVTWTNTTGSHTRSDSTIISYGTRGLPLPYFKFVPMSATSMSVNPGARLSFGYTLINQGAPDHWNINATDSAGNSWTFVFNNGPNFYDPATDTTPVTDTTSDGVIDTGLVQPGTSVSFWAYRDVPTSEAAGSSTLTVTVTSVGQPTASSAAATLVDTASVVNGVITPSPTASSTPSTAPASDCVMPSPVPTASGADSTYSLPAYTLHNGLTAGPSVDLSQLAMDRTSPYASTLYPYSTNLSPANGRVVLPGGTSSSTTASQYADWRYQFASNRSVSGTATLTFWVASSASSLNLTAYLYAMTSTGASGKYKTNLVQTVAISVPAFTCTGFQQWVVAIPTGSRTLSANDYIGVRIVNGGSVPVTLAYDVAGVYNANLVLPQK